MTRMEGTDAGRWGEALERAEEAVRQRAGQMQAELGEVRQRVDRHDEELRTLRAEVDAMKPLIRRVYEDENVPVPDALREEPAARLQVLPGGLYRSGSVAAVAAPAGLLAPG